MRKPTIKLARSKDATARECFAAVVSPAVKDSNPARGCLVSVREVQNAGSGSRVGRGLVIEVYSADPAVFVRINGRDYRVPVSR